jgi:hypothetical protein
LIEKSIVIDGSTMLKRGIKVEKTLRERLFRRRPFSIPPIVFAMRPWSNIRKNR